MNRSLGLLKKVEKVNDIYIYIYIYIYIFYFTGKLIVATNVELLQTNSCLSSNVTLLFVEVYLQKCEEYFGEQIFRVAPAIFVHPTIAAIKRYFPGIADSAEFLDLVNTWWVISNS